VEILESSEGESCGLRICLLGDTGNFISAESTNGACLDNTIYRIPKTQKNFVVALK